MFFNVNCLEMDSDEPCISALQPSQAYNLAALLCSLKRAALMRREKRLPVHCVSVKNEILSISDGHVISGDDVTVVRIVGWSRRTYHRDFIVTIRKVSSDFRTGALIKLHVLATCASVKPADILCLISRK